MSLFGLDHCVIGSKMSYYIKTYNFGNEKYEKFEIHFS